MCNIFLSIYSPTEALAFKVNASSALSPFLSPVCSYWKVFSFGSTFWISNGLFQIHYNFFIFHVLYPNRARKKKPRARGERVARNMAFIFSVLLSRFLFFCIMAPICCAPVVLGNDSFLIASTETWVLELPTTKLKKCTFRRVSNPFSILRPELFGCLWLLEDKHITLTDF